jgi:D-alanyl-D-alanine carboxypeptidase/D-alanyl-D-alanine-endopeptidase (penicillin-binding protein 4)
MFRKGPIKTTIIYLFLWAFSLPPIALDGFCAEIHPADLISSGGYVVRAGPEAIAEYHSTQAFIPASIIKIATVFAALEIMGPSHRFKTEFYLRDKTILTIKGYGDPFLTSEYIPAIATALKKSGITTISQIILDDSFFRGIAAGEGNSNSENPYDSLNSALGVNFNALPLFKYDSGAIVSGEAQTPLLPIMEDIGASLEPGRHRVNVSAFPQRDGISNILRYTGELISTIFRTEGIEVTGSYRGGTRSEKDTLVYTYRSFKTVAEVSRSCLEYSNNFIANQLFLLSGVKRFGPPATWEKGRKAIRGILQKELGPTSDQLHLVEGSGLSRDNRGTPAGIIALLEAFIPSASLLPEEDGILLKSGTLVGVHNYAGYFRGVTGPDPFVLLLNQPANNRKQLLTLLKDVHRRALQKTTDP